MKPKFNYCNNESVISVAENIESLIICKINLKQPLRFLCAQLLENYLHI